MNRTVSSWLTFRIEFVILDIASNNEKYRGTLVHTYYETKEICLNKRFSAQLIKTMNFRNLLATWVFGNL